MNLILFISALAFVSSKAPVYDDTSTSDKEPIKAFAFSSDKPTPSTTSHVEPPSRNIFDEEFSLENKEKPSKPNDDALQKKPTEEPSTKEKKPHIDETLTKKSEPTPPVEESSPSQIPDSPAEEDTLSKNPIAPKNKPTNATKPEDFSKGAKITKTPILSPIEVPSQKLNDIEASLQWPFHCKKQENPTVTFIVESDAVNVGGCISTDPHPAYQIHGTKDGGKIEISQKRDEDEMKKDRFSSISYIYRNNTKNEDFTLNFHYLSQKLDPETAKNTYINVDFTCNGKVVKNFTKASNNAPSLKVSSANSLTLSHMIAFTWFLFIYFA